MEVKRTFVFEPESHWLARAKPPGEWISLNADCNE